MDDITAVLRALAAQDPAMPVDPAAVAAAAELVEGGAGRALRRISDAGLCQVHDGEAYVPPLVTRAGAQWLAGIRPSPTALAFLPRHVDDLVAREALVAATATLTGEFAAALAAGAGAGYAAQITPAAFVPAVDDELAARLFAALSAVIVRLGLGHPAACVAEEVMAVALIAEATASIEDEGDAGRLDQQTVHQAREAMSGVFELFEDDDVLLLFAMSEPADAALAGHDATQRMLGVVDQRFEAWFRPFGSEAQLGHLARPDAEERPRLP